MLIPTRWPRRRLPNVWLLTSTGGALLLLGVLVLFGWLFGIEQALHLHPLTPHTPPAVPAMGLTSVAAGLALIAIVSARRRLLFWSGGAVLAVTGLTLVQYLLGIEPRPEAWLRPLVPSGIPLLPMSPGLALCFALAGASLLVTSARPRFRQRTLLLGFVASTLIAVGAIGVFAYAKGIAMAFDEGFLRMSLHGTVACVLLGIGLLGAAWRESRIVRIGAPRWLPLVVCVVTGTFCLWEVLRAAQDTAIRRNVHAEAVGVHRAILSDLDARLIGLVRMAQRWQMWGPERWRWEHDAGMLMQHHPDARAVAVIDEARRVQWIMPATADPAAYTRLAETVYADAARAARAAGAVQVTYGNRLPSGELGFLGIVPLERAGRPAGFIIGAYAFDDFLNAVRRATMTNVAFAVLEDDREVYAFAPGGRAHAGGWGETQTVQAHGAAWRLRVWPTRQQIADWDSPLPEVMLFVGLVIALLLAIALYLAQVARSRMRALERMNWRLSDEILERRRSQQALQAAHTQLDQRVQERTQDLAVANAQLRTALEDLRRKEAERLQAEDTLARAIDELERRVEQRAGGLAEPAGADGDAAGPGRAHVTPADRSRQEHALLKAINALEQSFEDLQAAKLRLIQAEKMDSVGRLAAGVAHEVKNPLAVIFMGVEYLTKHLAPRNARFKDVLKDMEDAVRRADMAIRGLLDFSVPRELQWRRESLNDVIMRSLVLMKHDVTRAQITVVTELSPALPRLQIDANKMQQVFVNLFMNAVQAMPQGGTLTLRTFLARSLDEAARGPDAARAVNGRAEEPIVVAEVDDTGVGIPQDLLPKIFDPFITTKPTGKGTGLGLAVTREIVHLHQGAMTVKNQPGGGVRVTLMFPVDGHAHGRGAARHADVHADAEA